MNAHLMSKVGQKTKAERPYSSEGKCNNQKHDKTVFSGLCHLNNEKKKDKYSAHLRKPDPKEEILILICIIKKGIKILCRHGQSKRRLDCKVPDYDRIYFFIDTAKRFDKFKEKFLNIHGGRNSLCCYSKLIRELKSIRYCFTKEIEKNYCLYKCKIDLINCMIACFRSIENKICFIMACSNDHGSCDQGCDAMQSSSKLSKLSSKLSCRSSKSSLKKNSGSNSSKKNSIKDPCECLDMPDETNKNEGNEQTFDMTLEYCRYKTDQTTESSSDEEVDTFQQDLPNGYVESKIYRKDDTVSLSIKCVTNGDESGIMSLKSNANESQKSDKLMKVASDMAKLLDMSKQWFTSGKAVCQQVLKKC